MRILSRAQLYAVYSSDLLRARVTAEIIAKRSNLKVQTNSEWREIDMGELDGRTMASLHDEAPQLVARLFDDPASFEYPGGESFACFTGRVLKSVDQLLMTHSNGEVVLVAHGGVWRAIIGNALGIPADNWLRLSQDYACLNVIDWYNRNPSLQLLILDMVRVHR